MLNRSAKGPSDLRTYFETEIAKLLKDIKCSNPKAYVDLVWKSTKEVKPIP